MKILILSPKVPYPPRDGGAIATLGLARGLASSGAEITMLCLNTRKHYTDSSVLPDKLTSVIKIIPVYHDTEIHFTKAIYNLIFSSEPYSGTRLISKAFEVKLTEILKDNEFDIIQLEGPYMGYYIPLIREHSKAKISLRAHNVEHEIWARKAAHESNLVTSKYLLMLSKRIRQHESKILDASDLLVPISERDEKLLLNLNPSLRSVVIPAGVDADNYPESKDPEYPSLFFIGSLDWMPNQEGLIWFLENVWPEVQKLNDIKFHVAGRNAPGWLERKIMAKEEVVFHNEVEDAYEFMNKYAIMVSPIFSGSGIRIKILEAMMMGKVVISTRIGSEGISYTHGENILLADDPSTFTRFIIDYSTNRKKYNRVAGNSRIYVKENFNNTKFSKTLIEFYRTNLR